MLTTFDDLREELKALNVRIELTMGDCIMAYDGQRTRHPVDLMARAWLTHAQADDSAQAEHTKADENASAIS